MLVGFCRLGSWILESCPVLVGFASSPCDPRVLGYLSCVPKLGHCRFECCLGWRCRQLFSLWRAFGRLIPRNIVHAWGLGELHILVLCHLDWMQGVSKQFRLNLHSSGWIKSVGLAILISMLCELA